MREDHIKVPLGLPGVRLVRQETAPGGRLRIVVARATDREACPRGGRPATKRHDARERAKADVPLGGQEVTLVVVRRRFRRFACRRTFSEPEPICGPRRRPTRRLRARLGAECRHQTVGRVAAVYGASPTTVRRALAEVVAAQQEGEAGPVRALGIDEFPLRKGQRYATGLHDLDGRRVLDVIRGRKEEEVQRAPGRLARPEAIEVVSVDMAGTFRAAVREALPQALIVADESHGIKRVTEALRQVWQRLVRGKGPEDRLRSEGKLVLRARERLGAAQQARLDLLLRRYPPLRHADLLKEDFRRWYRQASPKDARLEPRAWRRTLFEVENLPEFRALSGMFEPRQEEILNYFTARVAQGYVEGKNDCAKALERRAFGYRNVDNLRLHLRLAG
jgi:transposase